MTPMIPGFTPMQFAAPRMADGSLSGIGQGILQAALKRPMQQPGRAPQANPQLGLLGSLIRPAAPDGMLPDATGFNPMGASGLY